MQFILANDWSDGIASLSARLNQELSEGKKVLWLLSGGSNIPASVEIMNNLPGELTGNLSIMLNDERFGPVGHADSNWEQLFQAGLDPKQARMLPVLQIDMDLQQTIDHYAQQAEQAFANHDIVISQIGMGADGHIIGILPGSPAAAEETRWASGYDSPPYVRLTLTFPAMRQINVGYVMAFGEAKSQAVQNLKQELPLNEQPAQILKQLPEVYFYSDQVGEAA